MKYKPTITPPKKPLITYSGLDELRDFIKTYQGSLAGKEEIHLTKSPLDRRVINKVRILFSPHSVDGNEPYELITEINSNVNLENFLNSTGIGEVTTSIISGQERDYPIWISTPIYETLPELRKADKFQLEERVARHGYEVNNLIRDLFEFYGASNSKEKKIDFDFSNIYNWLSEGSK